MAVGGSKFTGGHQGGKHFATSESERVGGGRGREGVEEYGGEESGSESLFRLVSSIISANRCVYVHVHHSGARRV